jgi:O-antigen/teichoic acid export membrane protein
LFGATLLGAALTFGVQVLLARVLGVEQFGAFASALAMVTLVAPLAGFGLAGYWLKLYGHEGWAAQRWLPASFRFLLMSTCLVIAAVFVWAWLGPHDDLTATLLMLLATVIIGQVAVGLGSAKYQLEGRHRGLALWQLLPHLLRFTGIVALVLVFGREGFGVTHAASVFAVVAAILLMLGAHHMLKLVRAEFRLEGHSDAFRDASMRAQDTESLRVGKVMSGAWPFGLAGIFYLIYFQSDIILVKYIVGEAAAGLYNVAFIVMAAVYLIPGVLYQQFLLPKLHRWAHHDTAKLTQVYRVGNLAMLALGVVAMLLLWLLAPPLVPWLFGGDYRDAVVLVMILAVAAPFRFLASSAGAMLVTRDYMRVKVKLMGVTAMINIALNLLLIPRHGASGAAVATVATEAFTAAAYIFYFKKRFVRKYALEEC